MASVSLKQDPCSYEEKLARSIGPGMYMLGTPANDISECSRAIPNDPSVRLQSWGPGNCMPGKSVDIGSELRGLNYKNTKCKADQYDPAKPSKIALIEGMCGRTKEDSRKCTAPQEASRLSNPPCTLRSTGWNRWEWLCYDPQDKATIPFDYLISNRINVKDNHVPCLLTPTEQTNELNSSVGDPMNTLGGWVPPSGIGAEAPGFPNNSQTYRSHKWATSVGN